VDRVARAPDVRRIALMPDVHLATGVCVGMVIATQRLIYPQAIGSDIGCGMAAMALGGDAGALRRSGAAARVLAGLRQLTPVMRHPSLSAAPALPEALLDAATGRPMLSAGPLVAQAERAGRIELGTLGRGNHFIELQADADDRLWLMVHSGSRCMGQAISDHHAGRAQRTAGGLCHLDAQTDAGREYLADVRWAVSYADANRRIMLAAAEVVCDVLGGSPREETLIACSHNHVRQEMHEGVALWVHRKGANSAAAGEPGIIPGSMATESVHVTGRGEPRALLSSSHGAGRLMSRADARRRISPRRLRAQMGAVLFDERLAARLCEEAPGAYRDLAAVLRAQRDLVRIERRLRPLLVYKGM
jgi:tRNA-splicing ligase RtcB